MAERGEPLSTEAIILEDSIQRMCAAHLLDLCSQNQYGIELARVVAELQSEDVFGDFESIYQTALEEAKKRAAEQLSDVGTCVDSLFSEMDLRFEE